MEQTRFFEAIDLSRVSICTTSDKRCLPSDVRHPKIYMCFNMHDCDMRPNHIIMSYISFSQHTNINTHEFYGY